MKRFALLFILLCLCLCTHAQSKILGEQEKEPLLREADAVWSRRIWRIIDLRETMNGFFYSPPAPVGKKRSFMAILQEAVMQSKVSVYDPLYDDFRIKLSPSEVKAIWTEKATKTFAKPYPPYEQYDSTVYTYFNPRTIKKIRLKEEWYYNKSKGYMEVKIIGLCPMKEQFDPQTGLYLGYSNMFWIYFPEFKLLLRDEELPKEIVRDTIRIRTYEDVFTHRYFSSFIYKEDNVFNRSLDDYTKYGIDNLIESDKIKEGIRESEDALWGE